MLVESLYLVTHCKSVVIWQAKVDKNGVFSNITNSFSNITNSFSNITNSFIDITNSFSNYPSPWRWVLGMFWLLPVLRGKLFPSAMFIDMTSRVYSRSYQGCVVILRGRFILMYVHNYVMSLSACTSRI